MAALSVHRPTAPRASIGVTNEMGSDAIVRCDARGIRALYSGMKELKAQLAAELCSILGGYQRDIGAARVDMHATDLSRLRHGDLRRFSLTRIIRYIARAGYDIEVHLKKTERLEHRPKPRQPVSIVLRYNHYGKPELPNQVVSASRSPSAVPSPTQAT
jgi:hypothetical protein